jgi:hypothetical protein
LFPEALLHTQNPTEAHRATPIFPWEPRDLRGWYGISIGTPGNGFSLAPGKNI